LLVPGMHSYSEWPHHINQRRSAMAIVGSDAIANVIRAGGTTGINIDNIAFLPMPAQPGVTPRALTGGVPFVFSNRATDRQVTGALKFLEFMGLAPVDSPIMRQNITAGLEVAAATGLPILPTFIPPWTNAEYLTMLRELEAPFINVNMRYFQSFVDSLDAMMQMEEPFFAQEMYSQLDNVIQAVLTQGSPNITNLLNTANTNFQNLLNREVNR